MCSHIMKKLPGYNGKIWFLETFAIFYLCFMLITILSSEVLIRYLEMVSLVILEKTSEL